MGGYASLQPADFEEAVARKLLPRGLAWTRQLGSVLQGFWQACADVLAAVHARASVLSETESFPPTSVELLPDWEAVLGLPDPCLPVPPSTAARQAAVAARLAATGGQSVPYFVQLATNLGATIELTEYAPFRCGVDNCYAAIRCAAWAYKWNVALEDDPFFQFQCGISNCFEPLWQYAKTPVQCEISRLAPAHTAPSFTGFS